jgi:hypothetical protein
MFDQRSSDKMALSLPFAENSHPGNSIACSLQTRTSEGQIVLRALRDLLLADPLFRDGVGIEVTVADVRVVDLGVD